MNNYVLSTYYMSGTGYTMNKSVIVPARMTPSVIRAYDPGCMTCVYI